MADNIKKDLIRLLQATITNVHYPYQIKQLHILVQHGFYFDICQIIFPQLNIELIKIRECQDLTAGQKMQKLIQLLGDQLDIDLSFINGEEIIKSNVFHIREFLGFLEKFSELYQINSLKDNGQRRVRSDPNFSSKEDEKIKVPRSAREEIKNRENLQPQANKKVSKNRKNKSLQHIKSQRSSSQKGRRQKSQQKTNIYKSLENLIMKQKNRTMVISFKDNRKQRNQQIITAKSKYKVYLINYVKQRKAAKNREILAQNKTQTKISKELPLKDSSNIKDLLRSFQYKLRDQKYCYLKRMEKLIKTQQIDRMCYLNKIQRQKNQNMNKSTKKQLNRIENEHKIRMDLIKEQFEREKQTNKLMQKQYEKYLRKQKKELKENKRMEYEKTKDFLTQQNEKVLMKLQEGRRMERRIIDMYKSS